MRILAGSTSAVRISAMIIGVLVSLAVACSGSVYAQQVVALINDEPISSFDVAQRMKLLRLSSRGQGRAKSQAVDELIDETLKRQEARRLGVSVSKQEIDSVLGDIARRSNMSLGQFSRALRQVGVNIRTLRQRVEADLLWRSVIRARFGGTIRLRQQDVDEIISGKEDSSRQSHEYRLKQVVLLLRPGASRRDQQVREREAERVRGKISGCSRLREQLSTVRDVVVKDLGTQSSVRMTSDLRAAVSNLDTGDISRPRASRHAVEFFVVCERISKTDDTASRRQAESELMNREFSLRARRHLHDLRQDAVIERRN